MAADAVVGVDEGKLICTNGHIHASGADAECAKDRVAMIVYVGSEGESNATYNHGLAIALSDASTSSVWGGYDVDCLLAKTDGFPEAKAEVSGIANTATLTGQGTTYTAAIAATEYSVAAPTGTSGWFLPSFGQWYKFLNGMCGLDWTGFTGATGGTPLDNFNAANKPFEDAGYNSAKFVTDNSYWTSSQGGNVTAHTVRFNSSGEGGVCMTHTSRNVTRRVRSFLAF